MTPEQIDTYLQEPTVAVLSVSRVGRGPLAFPVWFRYDGADFRLTTAPDSAHGRLLQETGRATITVRSETYADDRLRQVYVMAEGPVAFTDDDVAVLAADLRRRYYTGPRADEWVGRPLGDVATRERVLVLRPEHLSGFDDTETL
jgi:nitroimidazol reductase NimA-like FMN-containing flavoprotein (pyridoxamine 5'-phosphate oxidase superfamily)